MSAERAHEGEQGATLALNKGNTLVHAAHIVTVRTRSAFALQRAELLRDCSELGLVVHSQHSQLLLVPLLLRSDGVFASGGDRARCRRCRQAKLARHVVGRLQ